MDVLPQQQGGSLRQSVEQSAGDKTATECTSSKPKDTLTFVSVVVLFVKIFRFFFQSGVRDTVIVEERSDAEASEAAAEPEEAAERDGDGNSAAAESNPDDQPAPGTRSRGNGARPLHERQVVSLTS